MTFKEMFPNIDQICVVDYNKEKSHMNHYKSAGFPKKIVNACIYSYKEVKYILIDNEYREIWCDGEYNIIYIYWNDTKKKMYFGDYS